MLNKDAQFGIAITTTADTAGVDKTKSAIAGLNKETSGFSGLTSALGGLGVPAIGAGAAVAAFTGFVKESFAAAEEAAIATGKLNNALSNTGQFTPEASAHIQELADKFEELTNVSGEAVTEAAAKLLQFGASASEMEQLFPILEGLAGRMGGDVNSAADLMGRALAGNTRGLAQFGVQVKEGATRLEILNVLTAEAAKGQGLLRAEAETLSGRMKGLSIAFGNLQEEFGKSAGGGREVEVIFAALTSTVKFATQHMDRFIVELKQLADPTGLARMGFERLGVAMGMTGDAAEQLKAKSAAVAAEKLKLKDAADGSKDALEKEARAIKSQGDEINRVIQKMQELKKLKDEEKGRADAVTEAKLGRDTATVEAAAKDGKITPEQAIIAKENLKTRAEEELFQRGQKRKVQEMGQNNVLLVQLENQRKAAYEIAMAAKDEVTGKAAVEALQKAINEEAAQREKTSIENERLLAEIVNDERVQRLKDEGRRIGAVAEIHEAKEKADQEEYERNRSPIGDRPKPLDEKTPVTRKHDEESPADHGSKRVRGRIDGRAPVSRRDNKPDSGQAGGDNSAPARELGSSIEKQSAATDKLGDALRQHSAANQKLAGIAETTAGSVQITIGRLAKLESEVKTLRQQAANSRY